MIEQLMEKTIHPNNYFYSNVRNWLNNQFLNKAFTKELQEYIMENEVDNSVLSTGNENNKYVCANTKDKIYLPSYKEMTESKYGYGGDGMRQKQLTDYAKAIGCYICEIKEYYGNGLYWLRSHDHKAYYSAYLVSFEGCMKGGIAWDNDIGVAPAITITVK